MTQETNPREYDGKKCPACHYKDIKVKLDKEAEIQGGAIIARASCPNCESTWDELYRVKSYSSLVRGFKKRWHLSVDATVIKSFYSHDEALSFREEHELTNTKATVTPIKKKEEK